MGGVVPIPLRFVLARLHWAPSVRRPGALARGRLFPACSCGSRRLGRGGGPCSGSSLRRGEGGPSPLPREVGAGASLLPLWGAARGSLPWPPSCRRRTPPRHARSVGVAGPPLGGGGDEGRPVDRSPRGPFRPEPPLCPPRVGNGHGGGHGGRGLHTILSRRAPSPGLVRAPLRRAGVGWPVGRDLRGSRRLGAPGRAVCRSSRIPHPRVAVPSGGGGASPRWGGGRSLLWPSSWGGAAGGGGGGAAPPPAAPPPRQASACHPLSPACPSGVYSCRGACRAATGQCGGGGEGGGEPPRPGSRPRLPQDGLRRNRSVCAVLGAAGPPSVGSGQGGSVRAVHRGRLPRPRCPLTRGAAASSGGVRGRCLFGLPLSAPGPEGEGVGSGGGPLVPWRRPLTAPGGRPGGPSPGGHTSAGGSHSSPSPSLPRARPSCRPSLGPLCPPCRRRAALAGRGRP